MWLFLAVMVLMEHDRKDTTKDNCLTQEQFYPACYGNIMKCDRFFHTFRFLPCSMYIYILSLSLSLSVCVYIYIYTQGVSRL